MTERPQVTYPCRWDFRLVGLTAAEIQAAVREVVLDLAHELEPSNASAGGKYVSMRLRLVVESESQRHALFNDLAGHTAIRFVL